MKKYIYVFLTVVGLGTLTSCADMLEEKNYGNPTIEEMMTNPENVALMVGQVYADLKWIHDHWGYWGVNSLTTDEAVCSVRYPGADWNDSGYWKGLNSHNWNFRGGAFANIWNTTISGAVLCNKLISTLTDYEEVMGEKAFAQYVGELEVMRSYYYYLLFDCFGRIPYVESFDDDEVRPLMEPCQVWSKLVMCLEKNAPNLPVVTDANRSMNYGRVTQGFAYALLARLYLNAVSFDCTVENITMDEAFYEANTEVTKIAAEVDFYTNAVRCCDKVIDARSYSIESNFFTNFKINNEASKENIFVIVESGLAEFDERSSGKMSNKLRITNNTLHYVFQEAWGMLLDCWNGFSARPSHIALYDEADVRGAGPALPEGCPEPPYVLTKQERAEELGVAVSDYDDDDYTDYRKDFLAEYNEKAAEYAKNLVGYGTKSDKQWGWFIGPVFDSNGALVIDGMQYSVIIESKYLFDATEKDNNRCHGARLLKYEIDKAGANKYAENDFVLMRYSDVLWMKEEALLRGGQGTSGANSEDFQKMLHRTFAYSDDPKAAFEAAYPELVTLDAADLEGAILDERGREFVWELIRRRDLIRFGKFEDVEFVENKDPLRKWFPIPYSILEKAVRDEYGNPIWTQNPGY